MNNFSVIKNLFGISKPTGFSQLEISIAIKTFGILPQVLVDYYFELGADESLNNTQDYLVKLCDLEKRQDDNFVVFYCENQDVCEWGIPKQDLYLQDPPVYVRFDEQWEKALDKLSDFLIAMAHLQAVFALPYSNEEFISISAEELEVVKNNFKSKQSTFPNWFGVEFYGNYEDSVIAVMKNHDCFDLLYSSCSKRHFDEMDSILCMLGE